MARPFPITVYESIFVTIFISFTDFNISVSFHDDDYYYYMFMAIPLEPRS